MMGGMEPFAENDIPPRYADGCVGAHKPEVNPICASHLRTLDSHAPSVGDTK